MASITVRGRETIQLPSGRRPEVEVWCAEFAPWRGALPQSDFNEKPIVGPPRRPFAELQILEWLERDGWVGGWVYRARKALVAWEPRTFAQIPPAAMALYDDLENRCGGKKKGCWDVFCWRDADFLFAESKWPDDVIRPSQLAWLDAALDARISEQSFRLVECVWSAGAA